MIRIHIWSCHYFYCIILYYILWLEFEESEKKRLAKEAAYAEAEREHVQVHNDAQYLRSNVFSLEFLFMIYHFIWHFFFTEEMKK